MTSLQSASLDEIREAAARLCRDYLTGRWKVVTAEQLICKRISGGLSNFLYYVSLPDYDASNGANSAMTTSSSAEQAGDDATTLLAAGTKDSNANACAGDISTSSIAGDGNVNKRQRIDSVGSLNLTSGFTTLAGKHTEPREVLLRIHGQSHGEDALEAMITESVVFALLSERNFGPKLHGIFPGGRIEQYIPARPLLTLELSNPNISMKIAEKMGEIHSLNIPMSKEPDWLWNCMDRWLKSIDGLLERTDWKCDAANLDIVRAFDFYEEAKWLRSVIDQGNYRVCFCHNDLQEGNILMRASANASVHNSRTESALSLSDSVEAEKGVQFADTLHSTFNADECDSDLSIIDFEYCAYNYRGFDLANHFIEWTLDYNNPQFPNFFHHKHQYPTEQQRAAFIRVYLRKLNEDGMQKDYTPSDAEIREVELEVNIFSMFSHLFWSLWSVVNVTSSIEFGYWEYAVTRIQEFQRLKQAYINNNNNTEKSGTAVGSDSAQA